MRLAWQCRYPHADHLLDAITSQQYTEILAFAQREPLDEQRADFRAAMQTLIAAKAGGAKDVRLADFLPDYDHAPQSDEEQTPGDMDRTMQAFTALFDAREGVQGDEGGPWPTSAN